MNLALHDFFSCGMWLSRLGNRPSRRPLTLNASGASGHVNSGPHFLTRVQCAELRRKLAEVEAKLRKIASAERDRRL
jgi:hypothetical protein